LEGERPREPRHLSVERFFFRAQAPKGRPHLSPGQAQRRSGCGNERRSGL